VLAADVVDGAFVAAAEVAEDNNEDEGSVVKPEGLLVAADEGTTVVDNCTVEDVVICTALVDEDVTCATEELLDVVTTIDSVEDVVGGKVVVVCCSVLLEELSAPDPDWAIPLGQVLAPEEKDPFSAK
jgi:hypothetical protein